MGLSQPRATSTAVLGTCGPGTCHPEPNKPQRNPLSGKERDCLCSLCDLQQISGFLL